VTNAGVLLAVTLALPLAMLAACVSRQMRDRMPTLLWFAPLPAITAALFAADGSTLVMPQALLNLTFAIDTPGAMLLGTAALLWIAAGAYACVWLRGKPDGGRFAVWWLMTLTGNLGVFVAVDMVGFYLFFSLVSLAAYGLVVYHDNTSAKRAAAVYIALAVLAEAFLLMGFVLLAAAAPDRSLLIRDAVAALPTSPWRDAALALLILGFGLKIGLVPLHVWMPLTYSAAPIPAAAVLSGAAVKAGVIGLIRFLPFETALPGWGEALATAGLFSAYYGVAIGITQANLKTVLAYSSVSQMGLLAAVFGMGLAAGEPNVAIAAAFYAVHHTLVKGGLFLAIGVAPTKSQRLWLVMLPAAALALGLGGLPLTGGALAKLAVKAPLGDGVAGMLATLSAIGSTLLMFHFLRRLTLRVSHDAETAAPAGLTLPWLAVALAAVVLPWALYPVVTHGPLNVALTPKELWAALWPVLIGALLSVALWRWGDVLPSIPKGDVLVMDKRAALPVRQLGAAMERVDWRLRQWPAAGVLLLALTIILAGTMLAGR
jgi:formate hydrogenlyase subunit 3/multisubunit Na+/H+ antiporter MnhD subunit